MINAANGVSQEMTHTGQSKVDRYKWEPLDRKGEFQWVSKSQLNVDREAYQRDASLENKILGIASTFKWFSCVCLLVARRPDGSLWVVDGQHRKLAADKRSDIKDLPCMIFNVQEVKGEAAGFVQVNTSRKAMSATDRFKANCTAEDEVAMAVREIIEDEGYKVKQGGGPFTVGCVARFILEYKADADVCRDMWRLCARMHGGKSIREKVFAGMCYIERSLRTSKSGTTLQSKINEQSLLTAGPDRLHESICKIMGAYGKGGARYMAEGIIAVINHKRKSNRLPSMLTAESEGLDDQP